MGRFDAVVVGGGPAGSSAAIKLSQAGLRVLLTEAGALLRFKIGEFRPPAAKPLRDVLGGLGLCAEGRLLLSFGSVGVWAGECPMFQDFIRDPNGHGWHLDRARFDADLRAAAVEAGAIVVEHCRFLDCEFDCTAQNWRISCRRRPGNGDYHRALAA